MRYLRLYHQTLTDNEWVYLEDPLKLPEQPVESDFPGIITSHDHARRFPWRLHFRTKHEFNNWPDMDTLKKLPYLWYIDHKLGLPYTAIDKWDINPKFEW
ncbi:hypothetical protein RMR21_015525 [Agrobacterium sp. rho-8.1]|nr:hypothetical protein [Agrobacterium sp. rho-8.1]